MKGSRRLRDPFASPAGELLAHILHHLPRPGHHLQGLGHIFTELGKPRRAAASTGGRARHDDPLARQMLRKWLACRRAWPRIISTLPPHATSLMDPSLD